MIEFLTLLYNLLFLQRMNQNENVLEKTMKKNNNRKCKKVSCSTSKTLIDSNPSTSFTIAPYVSSCNNNNVCNPLTSCDDTFNFIDELLSNPPISIIEDPQSYVLHAFDNIISPNIPHPADSSQTTVALRCFLYRKHFSDETQKLISSSLPIVNVEQLILIIHSACSNCGLSLN